MATSLLQVRVDENLKSEASTIIMEAFTEKIISVLNDPILEEYEEVLEREKFHFDEKRVRILLEEICKRAVFVEGEQVAGEFPDPKDIVFYEVLMEQRKAGEAYLVTGNLKHFPEEYYIVSPREMVYVENSLSSCYNLWVSPRWWTAGPLRRNCDPPITYKPVVCWKPGN